MWRFLYKPSFLRELSRLPEEVRQRAEEIAFETMPALENPLSLPGLERLQGYRRYYEVRIGDYRLGLEVDSQAHQVEFRRALHRRDIYRYFP